MANKTTGQWVGAIVGAVIGFFVGDYSGQAAMAGAALGGAVGGAIDPPKGPHLIGPRLNDLSVQTSTYGATIPHIYGSCAFFGNIFWIENNQLKEVEKNEGGGKGGGGPTTTTYSYYATLAVGLCRGPIAGVRRIWAGSKLIYDAGSNDIGAIMESNRAADGWRLYLGTDDQLPDPRMQAALGVANTPAYVGLAYIVFEDFALADYGNSLLGCPFKVEVMSAMSVEQYSQVTYVTDSLIPRWDTLGGDNHLGPFYPKISGGILTFEHGNQEYGVSADGRLLYQKVPVALGTAWGRVGFLDGLAVDYVGTGGLSGQGLGYLQIGGIAVLERNGTSDNEFHGCCINAAEDRLYAFMTIAGVDCLNIYDESFSLLSSQPQTVRPFPIGDLYYPSLPGNSETFCVEPNGKWMWRADVFSGQVNLYSISDAGELAAVHNFTDPFMGPWGNALAIAADGGLCFGFGNGGNFFVFSRSRIVASQTVPLADIVSAECLSSGLLEAGDIDVNDLDADVRGYKVSAVAAIRSALEPLQAAWPFDAIQDGYQIRFVSRGNASVATIDISELGAVASGEKADIRIRHTREMDTQLPRRVQVTYFDQAREYDTGEQAAERQSSEAIGITQIEMPIVMTANEAAGVAETLLYMYWLERHDVEFVLPPNYASLQPTDVITINGTDVTYSLRLVGINYLPDGRLECSAKFNDVAIYSPAAVGEQPLVVGPALSFPGSSVLQLLDIPAVNAAMDSPGILAAVSGYYPGWRGGTVFRSDDGGQLWEAVQGFTAPGATAGYATHSIGVGRTDIIDMANRLNVRLYSGALNSISLLALFNGANHFAYGSHGRWEIIGAMTVVEETDGSWTLSDLMRGRFGTEQYMDDHGDLDTVVLLDASVLRFIDLASTSIDLSRLWRAVSSGDSLETSPEISLAYTGVNLECLAPCYLNGHRTTAFDWVMSWIRRTRVGGEWRDYVDALLGEATEVYDVEIWSAGYTTLKRTFSGLTTPTATYTSAQQVTDFGSRQETLYVKIYQLSATVGRGYPLVASITRLSDADPFLGYLVFGLHFDGTANSTVFTDVKGHTFTAFGNAKLVTDAAAFGGIAGNTDGTDDYIKSPYSADWSPGTGDYTVRGFITPSNVTSIRAICGTYYFVSPTTYGWLIYINSDGALRLVLRDSSGNAYTVNSAAGVVQINQRKEIAWTKQGNVHRLFYDGTKVAEETVTATIYVHPSASLIFGRWDNDATTTRDFIGNYDDFQGYKACLYTANYTPATTAFVDP